MTEGCFVKLKHAWRGGFGEGLGGGLDKVFDESTEAGGPRKGSHADHRPNDKFHADFSAAAFAVR
jgi:hypothetical protein